MSHPLDGSYAKIKRAKEHVNDFIRRRDLAVSAYAVGVEEDRYTGKRIWRVHAPDQDLTDLSAVAGDLFHNLRSSLDHLAHQLVLANRKVPTRNTAFPIFHDDFTTGETKAAFGRAVQGMSPDAIAAIKRLQPYARRQGCPTHLSTLFPDSIIATSIAS